jgi:integrase
MGDVFKKGSGWYLRWYEGGRRRVMASKQTSHGEARRMLQAIEGRVARGLAGIEEPATPSIVPTVTALTERFLSEYSRPRLKSLDRYRMQARCSLRRALPHLGDLHVDKVKPTDIAKLRDSLAKRCAPATGRLTLAFLRTMFNWAVKLEILQVNPCRGMESPPQRSLLEFLSKDEAAKLLEYVRAQAPDRHPIIAAALYTGMRKGELFGLRWRDIDLDNRRLTVERSYTSLPKSGKVRHLRISSELTSILIEWRRRCPPTAQGLVFPVMSRAGHMGVSQDMLDIEELLQKAGCPKMERPFHALRHTFASNFVMAGGNILALQKILGHADLKMTLCYAHLAPDFFEGEMERVSYTRRPV